LAIGRSLLAACWLILLNSAFKVFDVMCLWSCHVAPLSVSNMLWLNPMLIELNIHLFLAEIKDL
jgi:hypothetical protein